MITPNKKHKSCSSVILNTLMGLKSKNFLLLYLTASAVFLSRTTAQNLKLFSKNDNGKSHDTREGRVVLCDTVKINCVSSDNQYSEDGGQSWQDSNMVEVIPDRTSYDFMAASQNVKTAFKVGATLWHSPVPRSIGTSDNGKSWHEHRAEKIGPGEPCPAGMDPIDRYVSVECDDAGDNCNATRSCFAVTSIDPFETRDIESTYHLIKP